MILQKPLNRKEKENHFLGIFFFVKGGPKRNMELYSISLFQLIDFLCSTKKGGIEMILFLEMRNELQIHFLQSEDFLLQIFDFYCILKI